MSRHRHAFSLIELLVVIAIIAILISLLVPAVQRVRESANRTMCANNLRQMGVAVQNYNGVNKAFPPGRIDYDGGVTWAVLILPYIEQGNFYNQWDITTWRYYYQPADVRATQVPMYYCPTRRTAALQPLSKDIANNDTPQNGAPAGSFPGALGDYAGCGGSESEYVSAATPRGLNGPDSDGALILASVRKATVAPLPFGTASWKSVVTNQRVTDGLSNTFLIGEKHVREKFMGLESHGDGSFYNGDNGNLSACRGAGTLGVSASTPLARDNNEVFTKQFGSYHPGICQFVFCDGSVRAISVAIDDDSLGRMAARDDGLEIYYPLD